MDSDSIVKRYARVSGEAGIETVRQFVTVADAVATSIVSYAEVRAALAARLRDRRLRRQPYNRSLNAFNNDWPSYVAVTISDELVHQAGDLAEKHALRGYDAIHLASALALQERTGAQVSFSSWDGRLLSAAAAEGLTLAHAEAAP